MTHKENRILSQLRSEKRFLRNRAWLGWGISAVVIMVMPLFILAIFDKIWPFKEHISFWLYLTAIVLSLIFVIRRFVVFRRQLPDEKDIALMIEKGCPDLMDSLICSVELLQRKPLKMTPLNHSLISKINTDLKGRDIHMFIKAMGITTSKLAALFLFAGALIFGILIFPLANKAFAYSKDLLMRESTGLIVAPGNIELAMGDDIKIEAEILRGSKDAAITISNKTDEITYSMYKDANGISNFEIFSVDGDFDYTISTSTIKSRTFHIRTYTKPAITKCRIDIIPPEYTRLPKSTIDELKDFSVPQGSQLTFFINTNLAVKAILEAVGEDKIEFKSREPTEYECELKVNSDLEFIINLQDEYGHVGSTNRPYNIECINDFPPSIQSISPEENAVRTEDSEVSFSVKAMDDYGLTSLKLFLSISGSELQQVMLFEDDTKNTPKEKLIADSLKLEGKVKNGDVIAYYYSATDNALPQANKSHSDIRFIEIRPNKPEPDDQKQCPGGKIKKLKVSDLIIEQKHLIRSTWDSNHIENQVDRKELVQEIARSASDLRIMSSRRLAELKGGPGKDMALSDKPLDNQPSRPSPVPDRSGPEGPVSVAKPDGGLVGELFRETVASIQRLQAEGEGDLGMIGVLFERAIKNMQRAEDFLKKDLAEESLTFQQQSLSNLVEIEIELEKNTMQSSSGEDGEDGSSNQKQEVSEQNEDKKGQQLEALLQNAAESLEKLVKRQRNLNEELSRNLEKKDEEFLKYLKKRQENIHQETDELRTQLQTNPEANSASRELTKALKNMEKLMTNLSQSQSVNALKYGQLAHQFLQRSHELIGDIHESMVSDELQKVSKALDDIGRGQKELLNETKKRADGGDKSTDNSKNLGQNQKEVRKKFDQFIQSLGKIARNMEETNPGAVQELSKALETAVNENISGKMKRSENAIRYKRYPRALDYQQQSNGSLETLSNYLQSAMKYKPAPSAEQLGQMLGKVMNNANRVQKSQEDGTSPGEKADLYMDINKDLTEITKRLNNEKMDDISVSMANLLLGKSGGAENIDEEVLNLLYQSAKVLESQLLQSAMKKKINLTRITGQHPPDEYKKLVNEYFKNLSTVN